MQTFNTAKNNFQCGTAHKLQPYVNPVLRGDLDELCVLGWQIIDLSPQVIATTSILNSIFDDPDGALSTDTLQTYLPTRVACSHPVRAIAAPTPHEHLLRTKIAEVLNHHAPLISRTSAFCADDSCFSLRGGVDASELLRDWRRHCLDINHVISVLGQSEALAGDRASLLFPALMNELALASEGQWPSVTNQGGVRLYRLSQMRKSPRWPVSWDAELLIGHNPIPVHIRDISESGFGFSGQLVNMKCLKVELRFASGRSFKANLAWSNTEGGGAEFITVLNSNDPLLRAARRMASLQW